jgi:uncharacterized repeat protein (TIGR01451 family)
VRSNVLAVRQGWRLSVVGLLVAAALVVGVTSAMATSTLDATNPGPATDSNGPFLSLTYHGPIDPETPNFRGQTFTALSTGLLDKVQVPVWVVRDGLDDPPSGSLGVLIEGMGEGLTAGMPDDSNVLASETVPVASISETADSVLTVVFSSPAAVEAGTQYALVLAPIGAGDGIPYGGGYMWGTTGDDYAGGQLCSGGGLPGYTCDSDTDAVFATFVSPPPTLGLSASSLSFGDEPLGFTSSPQTVTITNTAGSGSQSLAIGQLATGGANPGDFTIGNDNCSNTNVDPGDSCSAEVSFAPSAAGARAANLVVPSDAASSPDHVSLSGNGTTVADLSISEDGPTSAKRGTQVTYNVTVTNNGPSTAHNVVLKTPVAAGASSARATSSQGKCSISKGTVSCSLGDLAYPGGALAAVSVKITAKVGSSVTILASAFSTADKSGPATFDPNTTNNSASSSTTVTS